MTKSKSGCHIGQVLQMTAGRCSCSFTVVVWLTQSAIETDIARYASAEEAAWTMTAKPIFVYVRDVFQLKTTTTN